MLLTALVSSGVAAGSVAPSVGAATATVGRFDPGVGSAEALENPDCDPATKRMRFPYYAAFACVKAWDEGADNGGSTAQGVTADSIEVVVLWNELPPQQADTAGLYTNQATGENELDAAVDSTLDINAVFDHVYETWGREIEFTFVKSSGSDESAQRADAVEVAAMKPFAVIDEATLIGTPPVGGGAVFQQAAENAGVPLVIPSGTSATEATRQYSLPTAELVGKQLKGGKAEYAGDDLQGQPRKFGLLSATAFDAAYFKKELAKYGVQLTAEAAYSVPPGQVNLQTSSPEVDQQIPTLISKLKAAGVNNVIMMATHAVAGTASLAMKDQEWFPEITVGAFPYTDLDVLVRSFDQDVWAHAFGLVWFLPGVHGGYGTPLTTAFQWFWGTDQGTRWDGANALLSQLYAVVQFAGPKLTPKTVRAVPGRLRDRGAVGGAYSDSAFTFEVPAPVAEGAVTPRGAALGWWNPDVNGPGNYNLGFVGDGEYMYLDGGKRYVPGTFPTRKKRFFSESNSTATFDAIPSSEPEWPTYPCDGCPSTGATDITPAASGNATS